MPETIVTYIPALVGQLKNQNMAGNLWKGHDVTFYSKNSLFHYNHLLVSAWYEKDWHYKRDKHALYRDLANIHDVTLYGDSGGYQAGVKNIELDIKSTVEWQTKTCDLAIGLDHPPNAVISGSRIVPANDTWYYKKMAQTLDNNTKAIQAIRNNHYNDIPYFNVMHGTTLERRDAWYSTMEHLPFKYKAVATRPAGDPLAQTFAVCHTHSRGYRDKVHVLGVGSVTVLPILVYLSGAFKSISFDSSSYGGGAIRREYFYNNLKNSYNLGYSSTDEPSKAFMDKSKIDGLECNCPICSSINSNEVDVLWAPGSMGGSLITLHNLWVWISYVKEITKLFNSVSKKEYKEEILNNYIKLTKPTDLALAFEFADEYIAHGIDKAYYKYRGVINEDSQFVAEQTTLF